MSKTGAILLAAGGSTRMGTPKQLLPFGGRSLLRRAAETILQSGCHPLVVVLGCNPEQMESELEGLQLSTVYNERWSTGIGSSIRRGAGALLDTAVPVNSCLILLCDQPLIEPQDLRELVELHATQAKPVCASAYRGTIGPPVVVAASLFDELRSLPDDQGAKAIWAAHPEWLCTLPCERAGMDVDTPAEYESLVKNGVRPLKSL